MSMFRKKRKEQKTYELIKVPENANFFTKAWIWYRNYRIKQKIKKQKPQTFAETIWSWTKTLVGAIIIVMIINGLLIASFVVPTGSMENTVMTGDFLFVNKFIYGPSTPQVVPFVNIPLPFYKFPGIKKPEVGDVIVFIYPGDRDEVKSKEFQYYLKRCVATAGDTLQIIDKRVYVNGKEFPLPEHGQIDYSEPISPYNKWETFPPGKGYTRDNYGPIRIPKKDDIIQLDQKNWREWEYFIKKEGHDITFDGVSILIDGKPANSYKVERDYCFGMGDNRDHSSDSRYWGFIPYDNVVGTPIMVYWSWDTNLPLSQIGKKLSSIRWNRIAKFIN
ncbi:MAG: signal peptidase I [Candidatus Kapabacteria bacterium]|nr:signal peptidase I [Candidatus Kapabacteria bacterium]